MAERLGEGLAAIHQLMDTQHGLDHDNFIGPLPQANPPSDDWPRFYAEQRIGAQQRLAAQHGILPPRRERHLDDLRRRMHEWLPDAPPSLLHGDLWGGNFMTTADDTPVIYDPAVYFGHREVDLAFSELFGGFPTRFYEAYDAVFPVEPGIRGAQAPLSTLPFDGAYESVWWQLHRAGRSDCRTLCGRLAV